MKKSALSAAVVMAIANEAYAGQEHGSSIRGNDSGDRNETGQMYFANESRFIEANFSEPLTTFATGWKDPNAIEDTLAHVAPNVPVSRRFEFAQATNAEEFMSETDDVRAIGASFKRVEFTSAKVNSKTLNKGLTIRIDDDNVNDLPNWQEIYTGRLMRRLLRNELRRAVTLLAAAATNNALTWDTTAGKDPDQDITTKVIAYQDAAGVAPNRGLYGRIAWNKRQISHRAQNTAGGFASAGMTPDQVAGYLGLDAVRVSNERYQSAAATKTKVVPDIVLIYHAEANQTPEDPSNIKRFVSMTNGGTPFRVYVQRVGAKFTDITVEHYSLVVITSTLGVQKLTIS
jgi:hypothetical protein